MTQRPIKFRAWDRKNKKLFEVDNIRWRVGNNSILEFITGHDDWDQDGYSVNGGGAGMYASEPRYILEQFTGLKDKNGVEIFEGDLLSIDFGEMGDNKTYKVVWSEEDAGFNIEQVFTDEHDDVRDRVLPFQLGNEAEVIGNIHENPELLK